MKHLEKIQFRDERLPIKIIPRRTSTVGSIDTATHAFHEAVEIKYFYEGESTLLIGSQTVHAERGDVIVINPYEFHTTIDYGTETTGKYHLFMVGLDFFDGIRGTDVNLRRHLLEKRIKIKTKIQDSARIREILDRAVIEYEKNDAESRLCLFGLIAELFAELLRKPSEYNPPAPSNDVLGYYAVIEPALRMIRDDFSSKFTVDSLANACRISKFHFCRIFKTVTGMGAIQYLNSYRLKIADTLLKNTNLPINEISAFCGFDDVSYFCRIYKKNYNTTPKKSKDIQT